MTWGKGKRKGKKEPQKLVKGDITFIIPSQVSGSDSRLRGERVPSVGSWLCPGEMEEVPCQPLSTSFRAPELFCLTLEVLTLTSACLHPAKCGVVGVTVKIANL